MRVQDTFPLQKGLDPIIPEQANHPISVQCPKRWFQILLNCEKQQFVSWNIQLFGTNVWLPKTHNVHARSGFWIFKISRKIRVLKQSPICIVWQYYPHDNIVCIHMYDEYMNSIDSGVCHKLWSILWLIVQTYLLTMEYQVVQVLPNISISEQFESTHVTILQQISSSLKWWSSMHGVDTL